MLAVQLAVIAVLLTSTLLLAYASAANDASETKKIFFKTMTARFNQASFKTLVSQVLETPGETCLKKKQAAANALKTISSLLANKDITMKMGFTSDLKTCDCHEPQEIITTGEIQTTAAESILSCIENKLAIAKTFGGGFAIVQFEMKNGAEVITLNYGDDTK